MATYKVEVADTKPEHGDFPYIITRNGERVGGGFAPTKQSAKEAAADVIAGLKRREKSPKRTLNEQALDLAVAALGDASEFAEGDLPSAADILTVLESINTFYENHSKLKPATRKKRAVSVVASACYGTLFPNVRDLHPQSQGGAFFEAFSLANARFN